MSATPTKPAKSARHSQPARRIDQPEAGFFLLKLVRGGPRVAARIWHEGGEWWAEVAGNSYARHADPFYAPFVMRIWHGGDFVERDVYFQAIGQSMPPDERIDLNDIEPLF